MLGVGGLLPWPMAQGRIPGAVTQTLDLTQSVSEIVIRSLSLSQSLTLGQSASAFPLRLTSSVLALTDTVNAQLIIHASGALLITDTVNVQIIKTVSSALNLTQIVTLNVVLTIGVSHALTLSDAVVRNIEGIASSTLSLMESNTSDISHLVSSALSLTQSATPQVELLRSVSHGIGLSDTVKYYSSHLTDTLAFTDRVVLTVQRALAHTLSLTDTASLTRNNSVSQNLSLIHVVDVKPTSIAASVLTLTDLASPSGTRTLRVSDSLLLVHGVIGFKNIINTCDETNSTGIGIRNFLTLTYPAGSPALTCNLRNPKFGNNITVKTQTIIRRTRGGQLSAGRATSWPVIQTLRLAFEALSEAKRNEFIDFIKASYGYEIGMLDHENRQWRGVIVSPEIVTTQLGPMCDYGTEFEFRGMLV